MSTNYNILLKSEKRLKELIVSYLSLVHEIHNKLWQDIDKYTDGEKNIIFDNTERRLKRSMTKEDELLDECIWTISKDDPRANHLRFIISVIYSTKDLSRSCEYAQSIAKVVVRNNLDKTTMKFMRPTAKLYLDYIEQIIKLYKGTINDKFEKFDEFNLEFESKFEKLQKENRKHFSSDEIVQFQIIQICRLISSTTERLQSIFSSFLFSKSETKTIEIKKNKK
ncbi:PhoU domain-containing protein [Mesomycoplasma moatsii]|uniref:PhoU domain-containing protein n=1 Tax=Mesomycoplasma moatsii TaxID=171287 RepID=UPI0003B5BD3D